MTPSREKPLFYFVGVALPTFFLLLAILAMLNVIGAAGGSIWCFLSGALLLRMMFMFRKDVNDSENKTLYKRKQSKVIMGMTVVAMLLTLCGFLAACISPPKYDTSDSVFKPFGLLLSFLTLSLFFWVSLPQSSKEVQVLEVVDSRVDERPSSCCPTFCTGIILFLFSLASISTMMAVSLGATYEAGVDNVVGPDGKEYLVEVEDTEIFFRCAGTGSPTVVFWHGYTGNSLDFSWVQREISKRTRTCAYDRPGNGASVKLGKLPRSSEQIAKEAKAAFDQLDIKSNETVFVGHSFAGFNMRTFDYLYPGFINGMVMVDTVNPNSTEICDPNEEYYAGPLYGAGIMLGEMGVTRILHALTLTNAFGPITSLPKDVQMEYGEPLSRPGFMQNALLEWAAWGKSCSFFDSDKKLDFPVTVIIPREGIFKGDLENGIEQAGISTQGKYVLVDDAEHASMVFDEKYAKVIIEETNLILDQL